MCCSALGQIVYGALMLLCLVLTAVSIFTPGWTKFKDEANDDWNNKQVPQNFGILPLFCSIPDQPSETDDCSTWFKNLPTYYKVVIGAMGIALILEICALVWNLVTFCACCCKKNILHPLYGLAGAIFVFLAIGIVTFYVKNKHLISDLDNINNFNDLKDKTSETSYSFYIACAALICSLLSIVAGIVSACFADIHC
uniref:Uncharacterized protein n=1 Tax=Panagrolaimus sp. JU765 TaxID=591449 RepID=A0AC34PZD0_9BILA